MVEPDRPCSPVPTEVGRAIVDVSRTHRQLAVQLMAPIGLHPGQEILVFLLEEGPKSPGELADRMGVEPATITKMVRRTEAAGLVTSAPSPEDRRMRVVQLTSAGRAAATAAHEVWERLESVVGEVLDDDQRADLVDALQRIATHLRRAGAQLGGAPGNSCC